MHNISLEEYEALQKEADYCLHQEERDPDIVQTMTLVHQAAASVDAHIRSQQIDPKEAVKWEKGLLLENLPHSETEDLESLALEEFETQLLVKEELRSGQGIEALIYKAWNEMRDWNRSDRVELYEDEGEVDQDYTDVKGNRQFESWLSLSPKKGYQTKPIGKDAGPLHYGFANKKAQKVWGKLFSKVLTRYWKEIDYIRPFIQDDALNFTIKVEQLKHFMKEWMNEQEDTLKITAEVADWNIKRLNRWIESIRPQGFIEDKAEFKRISRELFIAEQELEEWKDSKLMAQFCWFFLNRTTWSETISFRAWGRLVKALRVQMIRAEEPEEEKPFAEGRTDWNAKTFMILDLIQPKQQKAKVTRQPINISKAISF